MEWNKILYLLNFNFFSVTQKSILAHNTVNCTQQEELNIYYIPTLRKECEHETFKRV